ncbi:MAG: heavy metal translocating P-type ATPase, partial [Bacillota bacterium]
TPGVTRVELNFAAAKLTVEGDVPRERLEATGKAHNITLRAEREAPPPPQPFWRANAAVIPTGVALALTLAGHLADRLLPEGADVTLFALAIVIGGFTTFRSGFRNLIQRKFDMDVLMTVAVTGAALIGEWGEGAVVAVLFGVSDALESYTMDRARQSLRSLMEIAPKTARVIRMLEEVEVPVEDVRVGETLVVRPGEKLAMDGEVLSGRTAINQANITGESIPVEKGPGDEVFAGTVNGHGALEVRVTRLVEDTTLARLVHLVEEAQAQRAPTQTFIERFAAWYTPAIMILAALVIVVPPLAFGGDWSHWIYEGLAILVVGCPCALVVSTPVSIVSAIANAARNGVLIKGGAHLERAGTIRTVAFDKTGTLTRGQPAVTGVESLTGRLAPAEVLRLAAAVEARSEHPLARAIIRAVEGGERLPASNSFEAIVGRGARAEVEGQLLYVGSPALFRDDLKLDPGAAAALVDDWQAQGRTVMLLGTEQELLGAIAVADTPRETTASAIAQLKRAGVERTVMLTGDNQATARAIGQMVGVDEVRAELLPHQKVEAVRALSAAHGSVAMVGDGVNDAPALAAATVGIAMGGAGTDVALETADIALMADDLTRLPFTIRLSRAAMAVIKQNIALALGLKLLALLAVFPGWLTLWLAILADMGATVIVTLNGMRLLRIRPES